MCARLFAFEDGRLAPYVCSYSEYAAQRRERDRQPAQERAPQARRERTRELRFSFKEQREYETIDATIAALEAEIAAIDRETEAAASDYVRLQALAERRREADERLEQATERWVYLHDLHERMEAEQRNG